MIFPQTQRVEGWPYGECVRASYATVLGIPIDEVPRLDPGAAAEAGQDQGDRIREWLGSIGYALVELSVTAPEENLPQEVLDCMPEVPHLISGMSPRGYGHCCVGIGGRVLFDPHPSHAGLKTVYSVGILVAI